MRIARKMVASVAIAVALTGCSTEEPPVHQDTRQQAIGESSQAYWFSGTGAGEMPTYDERVTIHLVNRLRMFTDVFNIRDMDGNLIPPAPPMRYQPFFSEAGRWQGDHAIEYQCFCPQDPMAEPAAFNSCCEIGLKNGEMTCVGPVADCADEEFSMEQADRWNVLNRGPGNITGEIYWNDQSMSPDPVPGEVGAAWLSQNVLSLALGDTNAMGVAQVNTPLVPQQCQPQTEPCEVGVCTDPNGGATECNKAENPDCLGLCTGTSVEDPAPPCKLNEPLDPAVCDPSTYPNAFYYSFTVGNTAQPTPVLTDGVALGLGVTASEMSPNGAFGVTPAGTVDFAIHYYEPADLAREAIVTVEGSCVSMDEWVPNLYDPPMMGDPREYSGMMYAANTTLGDGCHPFAFHFIDGEGFIHRYPTHGSLQVSVGSAGDVKLFDAACPSWTPEIPNQACLSAGDECNNGDTRACYTGRDGTQDKGICQIGTETCANGRWTGECADEVRPELEDVCGDDIDNNCNGETDEGCPIIINPNNQNNTNNANSTNNANNADMGDVDMGGNTPDDDKGDEDDGCGCATVDGHEQSKLPWALVAAALGGVLIRRRR